MQYRKDKYGNDISILGFGCMRFTRKGNGIDQQKAEREVLAAFHRGVNYYDTAYLYPGSEACLGKILEDNHIRQQVKIATKLPQYMVKNPAAIDKYFDEELKRLRTDHVDYYLMHHMTDLAQWEKLKALGIEEWLEEKKKNGQIRHVGFSFHGDTKTYLSILNSYDWELSLVQSNYLDEHTQAGCEGIYAAAQKGIKVLIMEPLRGGRLANDLPKEAMKVIKDSDRGYSPAEWSLRWQWDQKEVSVVLSGMNSMEMLDENIRIASETEPGSMTDEDHRVIEKIKKGFEGKVRIPCTGCSYCMPCPRGGDIPGCFRSFNVSYTDGYANGFREFFMNMTMKKEPSIPSKCVECGKCEQHCPQGIKIRDELKKVKKRFENPIYRIAAKVVSKRFK